MKYILNEEQFNTFINYINQIFDLTFDIDNIMFGPSQDFESEIDGQYRKDDKWDYYKLINSEKNMIFSWYNFDEPTVHIYGGIGLQFDEEFGNKWQEIFVEWFEDSFGKPVKKIEY